MILIVYLVHIAVLIVYLDIILQKCKPK